MNSIPKIQFGAETLKLKLDKVSLSCFILENNQYIITTDSVQKAMGYQGKSENWLYEFLSYLNRLMLIDPTLLERLSHEISFEYSETKHATSTKQGIEATLLIDACKAIETANNEGFLYQSEQNFARTAMMILKETSGKKINEMIEYATGFSLFKQNHKDALSRFMIQHFIGNQYIWVKTLPNDFFEEIFARKGWNWSDLIQKANEISDYLNHILFSRLDDTIIELLATAKPKMTYRKPNIAEKYLENTDIAAHLSVINQLFKKSGTNDFIFEQLLTKSLPKLSETPTIATKLQQKSQELNNLSILDGQLKKVMTKAKR